MANLNNSSFKDGFLEVPNTKAPKTVPIPTPAPAKPIVAKPAPKISIYNIYLHFLSNLCNENTP